LFAIFTKRSRGGQGNEKHTATERKKERKKVRKKERKKERKRPRM